MVTFCIFTFVFGVIMELSHTVSFANAFDSFQPHYSVDKKLDNDAVSMIGKLNLAKTLIFSWFFILSIVLRKSHYIFAVIVGIFLWPVLLGYYCYL